MDNNRRILVTGAGGPAGVGVIQELRRQGVNTLGCDINRFGAGLHLADHGELLPRYTDPSYLESLLALVAKYEINGLISTMTEELSVLAEPQTQARLAEAGLAFWFPPKVDIDACMDKRTFASVTEAAGQPVPLTGSGDVESALEKVPGPWIVKPCFGRGSRDVHSVDSADAVRAAWSQVPDPILQTRLPGKEFTLDALVSKDGKLLGGVPRFRLETKAGISTVGQTFDAPGILELTEALLNSLQHTGPANVQGFIDGETGSMGFIEVNPRFSGALPLSLGAGADLVGQYVNGMYGDPIDPQKLTYRPGTVMMRYFQEVFTAEEIEPIGPLKPIRA